MIYIINNDIEFHYNEGELISRSLNVNKKLLAPSTKILKHLIDNSGNITTQQELFKIGWGEKEKYVTNNAFYQNILLIRKAFEELHLKNNIITTVPRKGYLINNHVHIEKCEPELIVIDDEKTSNVIENEIPLAANTLKSKKHIPVLLLFFLFFVICLYFFQNATSDNKKTLFNYEHCGNLKGKNIYCNYDNDHDDNHLKLIEKETANLDERYKIVYLKSYKYRNDFSFLVCENKFSRFNLLPNDCISYYIIGKNPQ